MKGSTSSRDPHCGSKEVIPCSFGGRDLLLRGQRVLILGSLGSNTRVSGYSRGCRDSVCFFNMSLNGLE